jgi:hypothetical protein
VPRSARCWARLCVLRTSLRSAIRSKAGARCASHLETRYLKQMGTRCHRALISAQVETREAAEISQRALSTTLKRRINLAHLVESGERTLSVCEFI